MTKKAASQFVLKWLQGTAGRAQLEKVKNVPAPRGGPASLVALAINTSGNEAVTAAWEAADQKQVMRDLVKA